MSLREFRVEVASVSPDAPGEHLYAYRVTIVRGALVEYVSPWEGLQATTEDAARAEARTRATLVMALVQGAHVESLEPRGVPDNPSDAGC